VVHPFPIVASSHRPRLAALLLGALALLLVVALPGRASAQGEEVIRSYRVTITILPDGTLRVLERIDYDFGDTPHHGIFRLVPDRFHYDKDFDRAEPLSSIEVTAVGASAKTKVSHSGNSTEIKIGDANKTVTGEHLYTISYLVKGALNAFNDHDELYWNAIGTEWSVPIRQASAEVDAPAAIQRVTCFAGEEGTSLTCGRSAVSGTTATFSQPGGLDSYEGLTVVVALPKGAVVPSPVPILKRRFSLAYAFSATPVTIPLLVILTIALLGWVGWLLWTRGRDVRYAGSLVDASYGGSEGERRVGLFEHGAVPVEYQPPEGIRPGQVGTLIDEQANPLDVTATIVDLAVRGYLRIEEIPKQHFWGKADWWLIQLREPDEQLLGYERTLLEGLFEDATDEDLDELHAAPDRPDQPPTNQSKGTPLAAIKLSKLKTKFVSRLKEVQDGLYDDAVQRKWFAMRPDKVRVTWHGRAIALLVLGGIVTFALAKLTYLGLLGLPIIVAAIVLLAGAHAMPRRTAQGTAMVRRVFGFRTYIETAEVQEAKFQEQENLFSRYLPYAVVFGAVEKWAHRFEALGAQPPADMGWYVGTHPFTVVGFSQAMGSFAVTAAGTIASTPASSGHSGFGGGGGAGGGGGGGGGGSW
jgi:hypothetical protein